MILLVFLLLTGCGGGGGGSDSPTPQTLTAAKPTPPIEWAITGTLADGGTVHGLVAYDPTASPTAINDRNLHPNALYPVTMLSMTVESMFPILATPFILQGTGLCVGNCIFADAPLTRIYATNGLQSLQVAFVPHVAPTGPPKTAQDWGTADLNASWLQSYDAMGNFQVLDMLTAVQIAAVVP